VPYLILAWSTVALHAAFILFAVLGGFVAWRWRWVVWLHLPAVVWAAYVEFTGRICPLTPLEIRFRTLAGSAGYREGFVEHYLLRLIYPEGLTSEIQYLLGAAVLVINGVAYAWLYRQRLRSSAHSA
jgi:hypothetical protein